MVVLLLILATGLAVHVRAVDPTPTPAGGLSLSPDVVVVNETGIGKVNTIVVTNNNTQKVQLTAEEGIVMRNQEQKVVPVNEPVTKKFLEITTTDFTVNPGATFEMKVRTKFTATEVAGRFPAVIVKTKPGTTQDVSLNYEIYIPILIQSITGEYKLTTDLKINVDRFTLDPKVTINGVINNEGGKFFNPSGTVLLYKDNVKLDEKEVTTQVTGLEFPGETRSYQVNFVIPETSFKGAGEYAIESHVSSDINGKTIIARIKFIYLPKELLYLVGGGVLGIIVIGIVVSRIKKPKKVV